MNESTVKDIAADFRDLLLQYYSESHRFVEAVDRVIYSKGTELPVEIGRIGWSGAGSFTDSVLCDINWKLYDKNKLAADDFRIRQYMFLLGSYAIMIDPMVPNHEAIESMLASWGPAEKMGL